MGRAHDTYKLFLQGIRKSRTRAVSPDHFNPMINQVARDWLKGKVKEFQLDSKRIDDINVLYIRTDSPEYPPLTPVSKDGEVTYFNYPDNGLETIKYPSVFRMIKLYVLPEGSTKYIEADYYKANISRDNVYVQPSKSKAYYIINNNKIEVYHTAGISKVMVEYVRYFREYYYNVYNQDDGKDPNIYSVPFEFGTEQVDEIIQMAIAGFLENVKDPRYQSYMTEQKIRSYNN